MLCKFQESREVEFEDGRIVRFDKGTVDEITDKEAQKLLEDGAVDAIAASVFDKGGRKDFYKQKFSRSGLIEFCKRHQVPFTARNDRTIPALVERIVDFESKNGIIIEEKEDV